MNEKGSIVDLGLVRVEAYGRIKWLGWKKYLSLKKLGTLQQILLTFVK